MFRKNKPQKLPLPPVPPKQVDLNKSVPPTPPSQNASYGSLLDEYNLALQSNNDLPMLPADERLSPLPIPPTVVQPLTPTASKEKLRPPKINTDYEVLSAPTSPLSRRLASSFSRAPPNSFVRHSRVLSGALTIGAGLNSMFSPLQALRHRQKTIITDLPLELLPVVNLTNAQRLRPYAAGQISILTENGMSWLFADATLTGTELTIWVEGSSKPRFLNIQDCLVLPSRTAVPGDDALYDLLILQDYDSNSTSLRFANSDDMITWFAALQLAKFEFTLLNEAFTAVILSLKGPQLLDIYTLLSHKKRFTRFEWCNLRLPQVLNKWVKVFMAIIPGDSKRNGRVEMYTSDKITKKNLILYVNGVDSVYNVYPEVHQMIDVNLIMKLEGEIFVNKNFELLFTHILGAQTPTSPKLRSRPSSVTSLNSLEPPTLNTTTTRSRSTSVNSTSSFFVNAPSPNPKSPLSPSSPASKSSHFFKKQAFNSFVTTNYLYLMPDIHPGVSAIEIMLRNFVHIIDAFKLYGRPEHLNSNKHDPISMLFGLPSLPHFEYLELEDACAIVSANFDTGRLQNWGQREWRGCIKEYLSCRQKDENYTGSGNINVLFNSIETSEESLPDGAISPLPTFSRMQSPQQNFATFANSSGGLAPPGQMVSARSDDDLRRFADDGGSSTYSDVTSGGAGPRLGQPIEFGGPAGHSFEGVHYDREGVRRSLNPIVDLPTPMDDGKGTAYFVQESSPMRL